jgi:sec-independent protein translocase protein TatB
MIPEAGAFELVFLAAVALIVVGPKDLPVLLRKVGEFTRKMRGLADEFRHSFDEMARQSELDELRREVEALRQGKLSDANGGGEGSFTSVSDHLTAPAHHAAYGDPEPAAVEASAAPAPTNPTPAAPTPAAPEAPTPPAPAPTPEPARAEAHAPLAAAEAK